MQGTQNNNEKWKPMQLSNPASRIRAACGITRPPWMQAKGSTINFPGRFAPPVPAEPPPFDPDYEVIEFPAQQYCNTILQNQKDKQIANAKSQKDQTDHQRCDLCGSAAPCLRCEKCNDQTFCSSCDDMYHRHPKRKNHVRKAIDVPRPQVLPPLPPKGETFVPPVPPPRRNKRASRLTTPTPEDQSRQFKKEGSLIGSIKRFIGGRPLPPTPQTLRDPRFKPFSKVSPPNDFNDQPSSRDSGYLDWESDLKHRSGSLTALNNPFFPPLMQAQSMAQLNCPSCHHHGMMWDWGNRVNSPSLSPWTGTPTGTWHGSQMLPSAYRRQNVSPFDDVFWRRPGMQHPPSRSSTRSRRDLNSADEDEVCSKVKDQKSNAFQNASPTSPQRARPAEAFSDSEDDTRSKRSYRHRKKNYNRQSRETSPALSRQSMRRNYKTQDESNRSNRRFKKSNVSRNVSPMHSRRNSYNDLSESDESDSNKLSNQRKNRNPSPTLSIQSRKSTKLNPVIKEQNASKSLSESDKDSSSSESNHEPNTTPFIPTVEWECQHCTFVNKAGSRVCAVCCKTTSVLKIKNKSKEYDDLETSEKKINQSIKELNMSENSSPTKNNTHNVIESKLNSSSPKSNTIQNSKQRGKVLTSTGSIDVRLEKAVISTGTSPPPQSASTQTYDTGGGKLRRAASLADHELWKASPRSLSQQSILSQQSVLSDSQSLPRTPAKTPDLDETLNFEVQQPPRTQMQLGRRSFDNINQNIIRPSARRAGSQPPEYLSTMVQKQVKQGLEIVKLLREAEQHHFSADDLSVALTHCGENDPVAWLLDNWQNMIDTVVTLATNYGHERKENTIGTISAAEARDALRLHNGNVWAAVTECVEQRQKKYAELLSKGNFSREDVVTVLTANHGNLEAAYKDLSKSQLKPFLMRIWGPPQGVDNDSGDTSKLFMNDSIETVETGVENENKKKLDEVSATDYKDYHPDKGLRDERLEEENQVMGLKDLSIEQIGNTENAQPSRNIPVSLYSVYNIDDDKDNDIISASLKLGLKNENPIETKTETNFLNNSDSAGKEERDNPTLNSINLVNNTFDLSDKLQVLSKSGVFKLPLSSLKGTNDCIIFNTTPYEDVRLKYENKHNLLKRGFSHDVKSNFQPYRTVSVCDLSSSSISSPYYSSFSQSNNQINLSTVYYEDSGKKIERGQANKQKESKSDDTQDEISVTFPIFDKTKTNPETDIIPHLFMEVSHETSDFTMNEKELEDENTFHEALNTETTLEKGSLENENTKETALKFNEISNFSNHESKDLADFSDLEEYYETYSVMCDSTPEVDSKPSLSRKIFAPEKSNVYNVEFEKDIVFIATENKTLEPSIIPKSNPVLRKNNSNDSEVPNFTDNFKGETISNDSENDISVSDKSNRSLETRSISEDSSKNYQSVEENSLNEAFDSSKGNCTTETTDINLIQRDQYSDSRDYTSKRLVKNHPSNSKEKTSPERIAESGRLNFSLVTVKPKKKSRRFRPRKFERRLSLNNPAGKQQNEHQGKQRNSLRRSNTISHDYANLSVFNSAQIKSTEISKDEPRVKEHLPEKSVESGVNSFSSNSSKDDVKNQSTCVDSVSDTKIGNTMVYTGILKMEGADNDCNDANPNILEISQNEDILSTDVGSDINLVGLRSYDNGFNSSDSTLKNILSISEDTNSISLNSTNKNEEIEIAVPEISTSRPVSTDTHAGVESSNLDEDNENNAGLTMVENRAEILQLLRESLSNDNVLEGIIHTLFSTIVGNQSETMGSSSVAEEIKESISNENEDVLRGELDESLMSSSSKFSTANINTRSDLEATQNTNYTSIEKEDDLEKDSDEMNFQRKARRYLAEGTVSSFEEAKLVVHLLELNFDQDLSITAAKECSDLETALAFLQQECLLCAGKYPAKQMISMLSCEHVCCRECALQYFTLQITERSVNDCVCPFCKEPELHSLTADNVMNYFSNLDILLKSLLNAEVHELFQRKLRDRTLMQDPNFKWCAQCSFGFIADLRQKLLTCPDCKSVSCASCRKPWEKEHEGKTCEEFAEWLEYNDPGTELVRSLLDNGVTCPACNSRYALVKGGCMHLTCPHCKHEFCSDCSKTFLMGSKCSVSPYCEKLGLHAHHPRNCLFYLRDKEPDTLEKLLELNDVELDKEVKDNKKCNVQLQRETADGLEDGVCNYLVLKAGLCRTHYIEYLVKLINRHKLDPIVILDLNEVQQELRRHGKVLPTRASNSSDEDYRNQCIKMVKEQIPLE